MMTYSSIHAKMQKRGDIMKKQNTKYYISNKNHHFELILCNNSTKSYPVHNHVSVYTIGYMLNGMIELKTSTNINQYKKDDFFILTPYTPHALTVLEPYSMLIACIHKKEIKQMRYDFIQTEMKELLLQVDFLDRMQQDIFLSIIKDVICNISSFTEIPQTCDSHILSQFELHPEEKLSINEMAQTNF